MQCKREVFYTADWICNYEHHFIIRHHVNLTSPLPATRRATISWIMPLLLPSTDMDLRRVSIASWFVFSSKDSPLTAMSWSFTLNRPSCNYARTHDTNMKNVRLICHVAALLTLHAAPPVIIDLTKIPRSAWDSLDRLPLTLTPNPAEPESLSGISKVINSLVPSGVKIKSSCSSF